MRPRQQVDDVLRLCTSGRSTREIARFTGVQERTISHWRSGDRRRAAAKRTRCARCGGPPIDLGAYAYLLGSYLGDGHITTGRRTLRLWIYCDGHWPGVRDEVMAAVRAVRPTSKVATVPRTCSTAVTSYSKHWTCLFPQHGPGAKHLRRIELEPWQQEVVEQYTGRFLRGLFHSDGCRIVNWTQRRMAGELRRYEYPRYFFTNKSDDILGLCADALTRLGIAFTRPRADTISVARRAAVAALDVHVGPKA